MKEFFDGVARDFGIDPSKPEQWQLVSKKDVDARGGNGLLNYFNCSLHGALKYVYPEYSFLAKKRAKGFWQDPKNQREFLNSVAQDMNFSPLDPVGWKTVSCRDIISKGGKGLLGRFNGSILHLLKTVYTDIEWSSAATKAKWGKSQWFLLQQIKEMLQGMENPPKDAEILINYKHPEMMFETTKQPMELDIFVPSISLAFEYQGTNQHYRSNNLGEHHYDKHFLFGSNQGTATKDEEKRQACKRAGVTLVEVPFWWDRKKESLAASVSQIRQDLQFPMILSAEPIPAKPQVLEQSKH
jgi:hypothetical protein